MRRAALALGALLVTGAGGTAADAAPRLPALPAQVRVNVAGLGTDHAVIGSTGTLTVTRADGSVVYRGAESVVARRDVRRIEGLAIPPRSADDDSLSRDERVRLRREARELVRELGPYAVVTVPFELAVLRASSDGMGQAAVTADAVPPLRFAATDGALTYRGRAFRGSFELALDDEGDMIVVNTVPTKDYLASVVGAEMPTAWEPEALAAQAVAARTYLATHLRRHRAYDLEGDVRDQEYGGIGSETASTVRAVERTAGIVATYRGGTIEALYSANAGGVTEDSENVFANALPYLRSVPSPGDEVAASSSWGATSWRWTRELTAPQLRDHLAVRGIAVGIPERIEILEKTSAGRVMRARISGRDGTREIGKDQSRYYFGLRSTLFDVEKRAGGDLELVEHTATERRREVEALGASRIGEVYRRAAADDGPRLVGTVYRLPDRFVFRGRGFGHGVGMSQWGAQGMALAGASAEQILLHYYRGITLTNIGGA
ncbi:MAG TPA: SpoIID/LytB domain-containing protein [Candidatus Limnocylindria bacterium]|nr:SpoIID/LytB domain-containing protein [Candidatus Limnocylindria bacterium]